MFERLNQGQARVDGRVSKLFSWLRKSRKAPEQGVLCTHRTEERNDGMKKETKGCERSSVAERRLAESDTEVQFLSLAPNRMCPHSTTESAADFYSVDPGPNPGAGAR